MYNYNIVLKKRQGSIRLKILARYCTVGLLTNKSSEIVSGACGTLMDGWMDGWKDGWMDGRMNGWMDYL
jgi:hypothetical protein